MSRLRLAFSVFCYGHPDPARSDNTVPIDPPCEYSNREERPRSLTLEELQLREPATVEEQIRMTEIPAPPFMENERAAYYLEQLRSRGLADAYIDSEGNAIGIRRGSGNGPTLLIAAHLDTVFPPEVDTTVEFRDGRYYAPGIGDDTRGLAVLLAVIEVLEESGHLTGRRHHVRGQCRGEGRGDLRGVKAILRDHPKSTASSQWTACA